MEGVMSFRRGDGVPVAVIEEDDICELCDKVAECRPYGPNGKRICFECGMKDEKLTRTMCGKVLFGNGEIQ